MYIVVAGCHCALSKARRAVSVVVDVVNVLSDCYSSAGIGTVWTVRPLATVRKVRPNDR